jgi:hypothetical protein
MVSGNMGFTEMLFRSLMAVRSTKDLCYGLRNMTIIAWTSTGLLFCFRYNLILLPNKDLSSIETFFLTTFLPVRNVGQVFFSDYVFVAYPNIGSFLSLDDAG